MTDDLIYEESLSSNKTEALFIALTILFLTIAIWRVSSATLDVLATACFAFFAFFVFYCVNYRTLIIRLTPESLHLTFGIFRWVVPLDNVEACRLDDVPGLMRLGGAGIHFMFVRNRYRASLNFLEYSRVVIALKRKKGPVRDISFSTQHPEELLRRLRESLSARSTG